MIRRLHLSPVGLPASRTTASAALTISSCGLPAPFAVALLSGAPLEPAVPQWHDPHTLSTGPESNFAGSRGSRIPISALAGASCQGSRP